MEGEERPSSFSLYLSVAAANLVCGTSTVHLLGPPLEIWDMVEISSRETPLCGGKMKSSSSEGDTTSSSSEEESPGDESSLVAPVKRDQWRVSVSGVEEITGEEEGFEPAPLGRQVQEEQRA